MVVVEMERPAMDNDEGVDDLDRGRGGERNFHLHFFVFLFFSFYNLFFLSFFFCFSDYFFLLLLFSFLFYLFLSSSFFSGFFYLIFISDIKENKKE